MSQIRSGVAGEKRRIELPTWVLICVIYGGWLALTLCWHALPIWASAPPAAWLSAWHFSLQHELIHGHPTRNQRMNAALAYPPLNLWLPYGLYREAHLRHHRAAHLTDPLDDPESTYMLPEHWRDAGSLQRFLHSACNTAVGRVLLGPPHAVARFWLQQSRLQTKGEGSRGSLIGHAAGVGAVLGWVCGVCHIGVVTYALCFVYPGTALIMLRSLAEHRAADRPEDRTAIVEQAGLLGLLFLNNNLHVLHHERPYIPWYDLPGQWRTARAGMLADTRGPLYRGYAEVFRRYAFTPHHAGPHPLAHRRFAHSEAPVLADDTRVRDSQLKVAVAV